MVIESEGKQTRTDVHRPSVINPTEYEWVAYELIPIGKFGGDILGDCAFLQEERQRIRRHMERTAGTYSRHFHGGNCMVCGSVNAVYTVLFYHAPTNTYVRMGQDCAQKCEMACGGDFDAFKNAVKSAMEFHSGKKKAQAVLEEAGLSAAWPIYTATFGTKAEITKQYFENPDEERTVIDMVGNLIKYGSFVSEKQEGYLRKLLDRISRREEIAAQRQAEYEKAATIDLPTGRTTIEGKIVSIKNKETAFGTVTKMLVQHESGWKVWGTLPRSLDVNRGDSVRFNAVVEVSPDDPKFGFFSRPTKAQVIAKAS